MRIPKTIHYCWFGKGLKSEKILHCIESWRKYLPGYEIIEWNENNCDIKCSKFTSGAYKAKKWAFVADYFRFKILYEHGGIYLDTDMLLNKPLDEFLRFDAFFPMEDYLNVNACIVGAVPKCEVIGRILSQYKNIEYKPGGGTVCDKVTAVLRGEYALELSGRTQFLKDNVAVFAPNIMIINVDDGKNVCEHLYDAKPSWWDAKSQTGETYKYTVLQRYFYNLQGGGGRGEAGARNVTDDTKAIIARYGVKRVIKQIIKEKIYSKVPRRIMRLYKKVARVIAGRSPQ